MHCSGPARHRGGAERPRPTSGGAAFAPSPPPPPPAAPADITVPGAVAQLLPDGTAAAPADAPPQVQHAIWAANKIQDKPYIYGGGHAQVRGQRLRLLRHRLLRAPRRRPADSPLDSGCFMRWGEKGPGTWITVYTNPGHAYAVIAGLRLDTSAAAVTRAERRSQFKKALESRPALAPDAAVLARASRSATRVGF